MIKPKTAQVPLLLLIAIGTLFAKETEKELLLTYDGLPKKITKRMEEQSVPGISITLIKDFQIDKTYSYGLKEKSSRDTITDKTLFQAASISKSLTAALVLKEAERGSWRTESEVNDLLNTWKIPRKAGIETPIKIENLLDHSSGLAVSGFNGYSYDKRIPTLIEILNGKADKFNASRGTVVNSAPIAPIEEAGKKFQYSGGAYTVLQLLLEEKFDTSFSTVMRNEILNTLKMKESTFDLPIEDTLKIAKGHAGNNATVVEGGFNRYPEKAAAGLWTTSSELAHFIIDIQKSIKDGSGKLLSQDMAEEMSNPQIAPFVGYGLFLRKNYTKDDSYFQHEGWNLGYSSMFIAHKYKGYGVVILTNANNTSFIKEVITAIAKDNGWSELGTL